ncbi:caspase domain-containing protein, partial [Phlebopus sp. FC_14]
FGDAIIMPGCPVFLFFPRFKAYTQVNTMMWDFTGNAAAQNRPRSPNPPFPIPTYQPFHFGSQPHPSYPTPFAPLGLPSAPTTRQPSPKSSYKTFPRSVPPPLPGKSHTRGSSGPMPMPVPLSSKSGPQTTYSSQQHSQGHHQSSTRTRRHSHSASTQLKASASTIPTSHTSGGHRIRVSSTGNTATKPVVLHVAQPHQHVRLHNGRFEYSKCTGRKKALLIGINYTGQRRELHGCINDVKNVKRFLTSSWGYHDGDIVMLVDETNNPRQMPTRRNMIDAMRWLVKDAKPHDALFFHYSGHGGQVPDEDGDEIDGFDEVIYPVDYKTAGIIVDDDLHRIMVRPLPSGCRLTAIFDSCHSGTALDLPYIYHSNGRLKGSHVTDSARARKATSSDVISLAACKDDQTSADTVQRGVAVGAMSYAFVTSLTRKRVQSYQELLRSVREILRQNYQQKPQLSSSHPVVRRHLFWDSVLD